MAMNLTTMHGSTSVKGQLIEGLVVSDLNDGNHVRMEKAYSRAEIPVGKSHIPKPELLRASPTLSSLAPLIPEFLPGIEIGVLIGADCPEALMPLDVLPSSDGAYACQLRHGWTVCGPMSSHRENRWFMSKIDEMVGDTGASGGIEMMCDSTRVFN